MADRNQSALAGVTAEEEEVVVFEANAEVVTAPFGSVKSVMCHYLDDVHVTLHVTALVGVFSVQFGGVIVDAELRLNPVLSCVHFSAGNQGVTADGRHLFQKHDVSAGILGFDSSGETGATGTDHDHIVGRFLRKSFDGLFDSLLISLAERHAGFFGSIGHSGRERGAGNGIQLHGVRVNYVLLEIRKDLRCQHRVFLLLDNFDVLDLAAVKRYSNSHIAMFTDTGTLRGNGRSRHRSRKGRADQAGNQSTRKLHLSPL